MRPFFFASLLWASISIAFAQSDCPNGDIKSLRETWKSFRQASLRESPKEISKYYKLPVALLSPFDGEKPIRISKTFFLRNYNSIFRQIVPNEDVELFRKLQKTTGNEYIPERDFDQAGCRRTNSITVGIEDYNFVWSARDGWLIESAYYGDDYDLLKSSLAR